MGLMGKQKHHNNKVNCFKYVPFSPPAVSEALYCSAYERLLFDKFLETLCSLLNLYNKFFTLEKFKQFLCFKILSR